MYIMAAGRPTKYDIDYHPKKVYKLCLLGMTDEDIADFFDVAKSTINLWKKTHEEFSDSIKKGKIEADAAIAESLYHRAKGYKHPEEKVFMFHGQIITHDTIKHYPPDTGAAFIWLKNRQAKYWKDKSEVDVNRKDDDLSKLTDDELKAMIAIKSKLRED